MAIDRDPLHLHPVMRRHVQELDARLAAEKIPLRPYEMARSPFRQRDLYLQGRGTPTGRIVTKAKPWASFHQFGYAVDYVFWVGGVWTWAEPEVGAWHEFKVIAELVGLRTLSFEMPHVELPLRIADPQNGLYLPGGDDTWKAWLSNQIELWGPGARDVAGMMMPGAPPPFSDRPPLAA